jgi:hypothetical protein
MPHKVSAVIDRARNNFQRGDQRIVEEPVISKAQAAGLRPPPMSEAHRQGIAVAGRLARNQFEAAVATQERYEREKAEYEKARDDFLWSQIQARRLAL